MIREAEVRRKALFCTGSIGVTLLIVSIAVMFAHLVFGILTLIGAAWMTYKLFFLFVRETADEEANKRRTYVKRSRDLAKQDMKLLNFDLAAMKDVDTPSAHLDTCRCRLCR